MSRNFVQPKAPSGFTFRRRLEGHSRQISRFAWSPDGSKLATPSFDGTIRIWNWQDGTCLTLQGHRDFVTGVSWSPDGEKLASSSDEPSVKIWDVRTGACLATLDQPIIVTGVAWSPTEPKVASSSDDGMVRIWDVEKGELFCKLDGHTERVLSVVWSPKGNLLASSSWDGSVLLYDLHKLYDLKGQLYDPNGDPYTHRYSYNTKKLYQLAWSNDDRIAAACMDGTICMWDARSGEQRPLPPKMHNGSIFGVAFSPDGKFLATKAADNTLRLWRCDTWDFVELKLESAVQWPYSCVLFHSTLPILATSSDDERAIDLWDLDYDLIFPKWVPRPPRSRDDINILHLSDVHIGRSNAITHNLQLTSDLLRNLRTDHLHYLVVSGDFTDAATLDEYDKAADLINLIAKQFKLSRDRIILAPGNHDVSWTSAERAYEFKFMRQFDSPPLPNDPSCIKAGDIGYLVRDEERYKKRFDNFRAFYQQACSRPYPLDYADQGIVHTFEEDRILFLTLNSSWEIDSHFRSRSSINLVALAKALHEVLDSKYTGWLKIAVWHHPVTGTEAMNDAFLQQLTTNDFRIVLHGHIHRTLEQYHKFDSSRWMQIAGAGTFGAPPSQMAPGIPLSYNLMVLSPDRSIITVHTRKKEDAEGAWTAYANWGDRNNPEPSYSVDLTRRAERSGLV
jgi:WD40 repeat protein